MVLVKGMSSFHQKDFDELPSLQLRQSPHLLQQLVLVPDPDSAWTWTCAALVFLVSLEARGLAFHLLIAGVSRSLLEAIFLAFCLRLLHPPHQGLIVTTSMHQGSDRGRPGEHHCHVGDFLRIGQALVGVVSLSRGHCLGF